MESKLRVLGTVVESSRQSWCNLSKVSTTVSRALNHLVSLARALDTLTQTLKSTESIGSPWQEFSTGAIYPSLLRRRPDETVFYKHTQIACDVDR